MVSDFTRRRAGGVVRVGILGGWERGGGVENGRGSVPRAMAVFGVALGAVWLSNEPAGVMASYSVALIFVWAAVREKSWRPLWGGAGGLALGFGLTSFYLLPAAYEQSWVNIAQALSSGLLPSENFLYTLIDDPEHNLFNWIASSVAVLLMVVTGIAPRGGRSRDAKEERKGEPRG